MKRRVVVRAGVGRVWILAYGGLVIVDHCRRYGAFEIAHSHPQRSRARCYWDIRNPAGMNMLKRCWESFDRAQKSFGHAPPALYGCATAPHTHKQSSTGAGPDPPANGATPSIINVQRGGPESRNRPFIRSTRLSDVIHAIKARSLNWRRNNLDGRESKCDMLMHTNERQEQHHGTHI
jgi:hypothetical protein